MHTTPEEREKRLREVVKLTKHGLTAREIAYSLGCSERQVGRDRTTMKVNITVKRKVTDEEVKRAIELLNDGYSYTRVGLMLNRDTKCIERHCPGYAKFTKAESSRVGVLVNTLRRIKVDTYRKGPGARKIDK